MRPYIKACTYAETAEIELLKQELHQFNLTEIKKEEEAGPKFHELPNPPNPKLSKKKKTVSDDLICQFCGNLVTDPVQCTSCDILFCSADIKNWLKKNDNCPNCTEKFIPYKRINKVILNAIAETLK